VTAPLASISSYEDLIAALRARQSALELSHEVLSEISGLPERYSSKVLSPRGSRRVGMLSLQLLLSGLGVKLLMVEDPVTLELYRSRREKRDAAHVVSATARWRSAPGHVPRSRSRKKGNSAASLDHK
jgi:hypothetical protein